MNPVDAGDEAFLVPFAGPHARLTLAFDPSSFPGGAGFDGFPQATVSFDGMGLHGTKRVYFFDHDLRPFVAALKAAHTTLRGTATLESEEGDFHLEVTYRNGGDVTLTGHLQPRYENKTTLTYEIDTDQSYLNAALNALGGLLD